MLELPPDATLETVLERVERNPSRLAVYAFFVAKLAARDEQSPYVFFNQLLGVALGKRISEGAARRCLYKGFSAALKYDQPPAWVVLDTVGMGA